MQDLIDSDLPTAVLLLSSLTEQVCNVTEPENLALDDCIRSYFEFSITIGYNTQRYEKMWWWLTLSYFQVVSVTSHVRDLIKKVREKAYQTSKVEVFLWYWVHIKYSRSLLKMFVIFPIFFSLGFVFSGLEISSITVLPSRHHTFDEFKDRRRKSEGQ